MQNNEIEQKQFESTLKDAFANMVVFKDLKNNNYFSSASIPSFLRDYLLKMFQDDDGIVDIDGIQKFINRYLPPCEDWVRIKAIIVNEYETVRLLTKIIVDVNIEKQVNSFALPVFGLTLKDTYIPINIWQRHSEELTTGKEKWGIVDLAYKNPQGAKETGKIMLVDFKDFCPYTVDLDSFKELRNKFTFDEWLCVLLGAMDYNPFKFESRTDKLTMIKRLLPFVEKRINLIELAPKSTGKSYVFGRLSRFGYLVSGGTVSRAKLFYDKQKKSQGLIFNYDFVSIDEVQTMTTTDIGDLRASFMTYMEDGVYRGDSWTGTSTAGVVLLGNIDISLMNASACLTENLPPLFKSSGVLDRFHGFIEGWKIPRMNDDLKINGFALNTEYLTLMLHKLRDDISYRSIVDSLIELPEGADTRNTEAVKRLATGFLKLLFPNVKSIEDVNIELFRQYCLEPAFEMRQIIFNQMALMDQEFKSKEMPVLNIKAQYKKNAK
ncbi:MAG: BREX system Lon protease-like protein BrxL [Christensenellaceae bacterium]|jgi:ATP-dependent Lon protease|nr:BREX system Lon protease-like protein BrxL [Christensenellaceae bacterium]